MIQNMTSMAFCDVGFPMEQISQLSFSISISRIAGKRRDKTSFAICGKSPRWRLEHGTAVFRNKGHGEES
jgi:hypothetical protein